MIESASPRRQCAKCPWKKDVDPFDIPGGYDPEKHRALIGTIAESGAIRPGAPLRIFACHETDPGNEIPCVGWLANQLGPGNNIALRLKVWRGELSDNFEIVGPQRETFEETLPRKQSKRAAKPKEQKRCR